MKLDDAQLQSLKADMRLIVIQTPSPIFEYTTRFQVSARLKNWDLLSAKDDFLAESSATVCTLSLVGDLAMLVSIAFYLILNRYACRWLKR